MNRRPHDGAPLTSFTLVATLCGLAACGSGARADGGDAGLPDAGAWDAGPDGGAGCSEHAQCAASGVCLPDGTCADPAQVAYVDPGGSDNPQCTKESPCTRAMAALATARPYLKLHGTTDEAVTIDRDVTILADPGAKLTHTPVDPRGEPVLVVTENANGVLHAVHVAIYDLEVTGAQGPFFGYGIQLVTMQSTVELHRVKVTNNAGTGIFGSGGILTVSDSTVTGNGSTGTGLDGYGALSGIYVMETTLTVSRSDVSGNARYGVYVFGHGITVSRCTVTGSTLSRNAAGGLDVLNAVSVNVVDDFFFANGSATSDSGGLIVESLQVDEPAMNRLEFNSFNQNRAKDGVGSAIQCGADVTLAARNDILFGNGTATNPEQVGGPCTHAYSIVAPGTLPPGNGNLAINPVFVSATTGDLHLQAVSPASGAADPGSDLTGSAAVDIDGDARSPGGHRRRRASLNRLLGDGLYRS